MSMSNQCRDLGHLPNPLGVNYSDFYPYFSLFLFRLSTATGLPYKPVIVLLLHTFTVV